MVANVKSRLHPADELGQLRAQIAPLRAREEEIEAQLKAQGAGEYKGKLYRVKVSVFDATVTAWKDIAEKLGASTQMITGNSKTVEKRTVKVTALLTEKQAA